MKKLLYIFLTVLIVGCSGEDGGDNNQSSCPIYLDSNGITIKACDDANVGDTGVINGVTYTVVDEGMLREMVANEEDVTKLATTKVTNMSRMFYINYDTESYFNQPIGNWDTSNVTDMYRMFNLATSFDQPIGNWDVSNVIDMRGMFEYSSSFNQPIGNWDVSNVYDMVRIFQNALAFNQPIGNWDVSNVVDMRGMFEYSPSFNQPIGNWDVSNVTDMRSMFNNANVFNKDLSSWSVDGVTQCVQFSDGATSWTLPQPNFTNCNPN